MQEGEFEHGGEGKHFSKTFSIFYMLNCKKKTQKQSFLAIFFNWYLSNQKTAFAVNLSVKTSTFSIEKLSFSLKPFSGHFYGQSFIKTV